MSDKWRGLNGPITAEAAEAEPEADRVFGSAYIERQRQLKARGDRISRITTDPWRKPKIERQVTQ